MSTGGIAPPVSTGRCARCATELARHVLACPACQTLVHGNRLRELADLATASTDQATARALWEEAQQLVPIHSEQHRQIGLRLAELADDAAVSAPGDRHTKTGWTKVIGAAAAVGVLIAGKFKFLLLGLGKLSTLTSMFGFIAVYWSIHGWPLAWPEPSTFTRWAMYRCCAGSASAPMLRSSFPVLVRSCS